METWTDDSQRREVLSFLGGASGFTAVTEVPVASLLDSVKERLRSLQLRHSSAAAAPLLADVLGEVGRVALRCRQGGLLHTPELREFLAETATTLLAERDVIIAYPGALLDALERDDDWSMIYRRRSALQFFLDVYRESALAPTLRELEHELEDLDELLWRQALPSNKPDQRMPRSHWWWWL